MKFKDLKIGDTFYYGGLLFSKLAGTICHCDACCIPKGQLRRMGNVEVDPTPETIKRHNIVRIKDIKPGTIFYYDGSEYLKTSSDGHYVRLEDGSLEEFSLSEEEEMFVFVSAIQGTYNEKRKNSIEQS